MYKAKNGLIINDPETPGGWTIQSDADIITALLVYPYFQTVYAGILLEKVDEARRGRREYENIEDLAQELATNYI